jgi:AAA+ superfamily predicted ATPase
LAITSAPQQVEEVLVSSVNVIVAATAADIEAETIAAAVAERADMTLVGHCVQQVGQVDALLKVAAKPCAVLLIGPDDDTGPIGERYLRNQPDCVVVCVSAPRGDIVRIARQGLGLDELLAEVRALVTYSGTASRSRILHLGADRTAEQRAPERLRGSARRDSTLLVAAVRWIHALLRNAVAGLTSGGADLPGLTVTAATVLTQLDAGFVRTAPDAVPSVKQAEDSLVREFAERNEDFEPLRIVARTLALSDLERRVLVLALAPELNPLYQRCIGVLLDDLGRRVGTLGLCAALLGEPSDVRVALGATGSLARWRVFDTHAGLLPAADDPLRVDPFLVAWILGDRAALLSDPRVRRALRLSAWPGASLIDAESERFRADTFVDMLQGEHDGQWLLFGGDDPAGWRGLLELGARIRQCAPIRVEATRVVSFDSTELEECATRLGRAARVTGAPLIIDVARLATTPEADEALQHFFAVVAASGCRVAVICTDAARIARLLGTRRFLLMEGPALPAATKEAAFLGAARSAGASLEPEQSRSLASLHPLSIDGYEHAMSVALSDQQPDATAESRLDGFMAACKHVAAQGLSQLAERIEPIFTLDDVVLPPDRKQQLNEIVDNVRLAERVLVGWKFGEQLPYGRGVTALLHGPSGTGKTMAALAVARRLGVQLLRIDLSRVVSKYIGDTEKNIDRVFEDARNSGAALLIDEADALLGKRSEVKDAHDRYANIEVAYLLQRMEAYEGLAIMTTNLRQNLDAAFLRRLRFIIDFPRPDVAAREEIWRRCLPEKSHRLDAAAFRQLGRKIELTGGNIRQITLRAAFVAAAANKSISLEHIAYATNAELAKLGRPSVVLELPDGKKAAA